MFHWGQFNVQINDREVSIHSLILPFIEQLIRNSCNALL